MTISIRHARIVLDALQKHDVFTVRFVGETKDRQITKFREVARRGRKGGMDLFFRDSEGTEYFVADRANFVKGFTAPSEGDDAVFTVTRLSDNAEMRFSSRREIGKGELPAHLHIVSMPLDQLPKVEHVRAWKNAAERAVSPPSEG